jgi:hypothetical protein
MAGFADVIRAGVGIADSLTSTLQVTVGHEKWLDQTTDGDPTYARKVFRKAVLDLRLSRVRTPQGQEVVSRASLTFVRPTVVAYKDRITLPDGSTGPILSINGFVDADTKKPFLAEVWLG